MCQPKRSQNDSLEGVVLVSRKRLLGRSQHGSFELTSQYCTYQPTTKLVRIGIYARKSLMKLKLCNFIVNMFYVIVQQRSKKNSLTEMLSTSISLQQTFQKGSQKCIDASYCGQEI